MKTFMFTQKNDSITIILSANTFEEAEVKLFETVKDNHGWRVDNEEGDEEEEFDD